MLSEDYWDSLLPHCLQLGCFNARPPARIRQVINAPVNMSWWWDVTGGVTLGVPVLI